MAGGRGLTTRVDGAQHQVSRTYRQVGGTNRTPKRARPGAERAWLGAEWAWLGAEWAGLGGGWAGLTDARRLLPGEAGQRPDAAEGGGEVGELVHLGVPAGRRHAIAGDEGHRRDAVQVAVLRRVVCGASGGGDVNHTATGIIFAATSLRCRL